MAIFYFKRINAIYRTIDVENGYPKQIFLSAFSRPVSDSGVSFFAAKSFYMADSPLNQFLKRT